MRPPYFQITASCENDRCDSFGFTVNRKKIKKVATDGHEYTISRLVCPECRAWGTITNIKEVLV